MTGAIAATAAGGPARWAEDLAGTDPAAVAVAAARLGETVARGGLPAAEAVSLARALAAALGQAGEHGRARAALLLGILAERHPEAAGTAGDCAGDCLGLLPAAPGGSAEYLALLYLLAHFPAQRARIMAVAGDLAAADPDGISRLGRILQPLNLSDPADWAAAGRSWPSPAYLAVTAEEEAATAASRLTQPAAQIAASWHADTAALLAYAGGLAAARGA